MNKPVENTLTRDVLQQLAEELSGDTPPRDTQTGHRLACMEVWGGNAKVECEIELPGLAGWIHSKPLDPAHGGGDLYYMSACNHGLLSRIALADVEGHGEIASMAAGMLHDLMRRYANTWDQSDFMRELNRAFRQGSAVNFATMVVLGYERLTAELLLANAGHLPPLWYHAAGMRWDWFAEDRQPNPYVISGIPLGLIAGTDYRQTGHQLEEGDLLVIYTDGVIETANQAGEEFGQEGLLQTAPRLPVSTPSAAGRALLAAVRRFAEGTLTRDDETLIVLKCQAHAAAS